MNKHINFTLCDMYVTGTENIYHLFLFSSNVWYYIRIYTKI